jgi:hypothetical protein
MKARNDSHDEWRFPSSEPLKKDRPGMADGKSKPTRVFTSATTP